MADKKYTIAIIFTIVYVLGMLYLSFYLCKDEYHNIKTMNYCELLNYRIEKENRINAKQVLLLEKIVAIQDKKCS